MRRCLMRYRWMTMMRRRKNRKKARNPSQNQSQRLKSAKAVQVPNDE
jgi:hypothetical protein